MVVSSAMGRIRTSSPSAWRTFYEALRLLRSVMDSYAKRRLAWAFALVTGGAIAGGLTPIAFQLAVDMFSTGGTANSIVSPAFLVAVYVGGQYLSYTLVDLRLLVFGEADQRVRRRVSEGLFAHVVRMPMRNHLDRKAGEIGETTEQGVTGYQLLLTHLVYTVLPVIVEFVVVISVLVHFKHAQYLGILGISVVAYIYAFSRGAQGMRRPAEAASKGHIEASGVLTDALVNCETIKYFSAESVVCRRYDNAQERCEAWWRVFYRKRAITGLTVGGIFVVSLAWSLSWATSDVMRGAMTVGELVLVNTYVLRLVQPLSALGIAIRDISQGLAFLDKMLELFREPVESAVVKVKERQQHDAGHGEVVFENVTFSYRPGQVVLKDVSFTVRAGRTVAVVGASGSGKSSLSRLLFRLYEVGDGRILLDGVPINEMSLSAVRDAVAIVPQDTVLFHDTVESNISLGQHSVSRREIEEAARIAHLHEFILRLPEAYETVVGERGLKLSGGERQRVAIARAALKRPRIFVFDELTSSLDSRTEREILRNLVEVSNDSTTLVIAHRLETIVHADEILVLDKGSIVERGTHCELLVLNGQYAALWNAQHSGSATDFVSRCSVA